MARVFISYRRRDNEYVAEMLRDALEERFGRDEVFFDLDNIPFGVDFREYIATAVGSCDVLLVVIGDQWLHLTGEDGKRRLDNPSDYVRIEIESALKRNIPVVPVLIEQARMPSETDLPEPISAMAFRNAAEIRAGRDRKQQIARLVSDLERRLAAGVSREPREVQISSSTVSTTSATPSVASATAAPSKPETILKLFQGDFSNTLKQILEKELVDGRRENLKTKLLFCVHANFEAKSKFVSFYIPLSPSTFDACHLLADGAQGFLDEAATVKVGSLTPGDSNTEWSKDLLFTGKFYAYHESELSHEQMGQLEAIYKSKGFSIQFRGQNYATTRFLQSRAK